MVPFRRSNFHVVVVAGLRWILAAATSRRTAGRCWLGRRIAGSACCRDRRAGSTTGQAGKVAHKLLALLGQRGYAVALGHEDVNDHGAVRDDLALQTALGHGTSAAGRSRGSSTPPTLLVGHHPLPIGLK